MSETWCPSTHCSTAAKSDARHAVSRRRTSSGGSPSPTQNVKPESATQPRSVTPTSTESTSPSRSVYGPGMPCTTMSLGETQIEAGKP
jgi:hypothetical protein